MLQIIQNNLYYSFVFTWGILVLCNACNCRMYTYLTNVHKDYKFPKSLKYFQTHAILRVTLKWCFVGTSYMANRWLSKAHESFDILIMSVCADKMWVDLCKVLMWNRRNISKETFVLHQGTSFVCASKQLGFSNLFYSEVESLCECRRYTKCNAKCAYSIKKVEELHTSQGNNTT